MGTCNSGDISSVVNNISSVVNNIGKLMQAVKQAILFRVTWDLKLHHLNVNLGVTVYISVRIISYTFR